MTPEEERQYVANNLVNKFGLHRSKHPDLENLKDFIEDYSHTKRKLILDILTYGDDKVLTLVNGQ